MILAWRDVREHTRFTPEFKEDAVKQVTERGYSVVEVSARLGSWP
ncbi:hypothetical protein CH06BL_18060 [Chromobacterium haemolyticum]|nr:hypothetical protein CH06BL_18060 [Chromobacterium haemolyticum]